jgi:V8-like Glu-specific endopeptidase
MFGCSKRHVLVVLVLPSNALVRLYIYLYYILFSPPEGSKDSAEKRRKKMVYVRARKRCLPFLLSLYFLLLRISECFERDGGDGLTEQQDRDRRRRRRRLRHGSSTNWNDPIQPRIVNGRNVYNEYERYPYFVTLRDANNYHICGGTLIATDMVLTAAHCYK